MSKAPDLRERCKAMYQKMQTDAQEEIEIVVGNECNQAWLNMMSKLESESMPWWRRFFRFLHRAPAYLRRRAAAPSQEDGEP